MAIEQFHDDEGNEERGLTVYSSQPRYPNPGQGFLMPLGDAHEARAAIAAYEDLKRAIVRPDDIQIIQGREFLKKSFWRRVAACFGLSAELVREERLNLDGKLAYRATYRAIAPNGRTMDGDGMCMQGEKGQMIEHNIRAIAHTRAKNRAISDLVGGGEVSAEEMPDEERAPVRPAQASGKAEGKATRQAQWNALEDGDVRLRLQQLGQVDDEEKRAALTEIHAEMKAAGEPWTKPGVLKRLALAPGGHASLDDLPVGTRGN